MPLRDVFSFRGRLSRLGYWRMNAWLMAVFSIIWCVGLFAILLVGRVGGLLFLAIIPMTVVATVAMGVRRLHDRGKGGIWWVVFGLGPLALAGASDALSHNHDLASGLGILALSLATIALSLWGWIEIGFRRGTAEANRYGPPPPYGS